MIYRLRFTCPTPVLGHILSLSNSSLPALVHSSYPGSIFPPLLKYVSEITSHAQPGGTGFLLTYFSVAVKRRSMAFSSTQEIAILCIPNCMPEVSLSFRSPSAPICYWWWPSYLTASRSNFIFSYVSFIFKAWFTRIKGRELPL